MLCTYQAGSKSFLRADGTALNRAEGRTSYFEDALPFSEGLAAVKITGPGAMWTPRANSSSSRSIPRPGASGGGCAAVYGGGMWQVIDSTGAVRLELPGVDSVT